MSTRRTFLKYSGGTSLALYVGGECVAAIPGGSLNPALIPRYVAPLVVPPPMPSTAPNQYEIALRQFRQQVLPPGLPATTVWGYGSRNHPGSFNFPAFTIEAKAGVPTTVKWINELVDDKGRYLPHLLPVDPTLHWANPPGGLTRRDSHPTFATTPGRYRGPVPMVTHVHGMQGVGDESDGYAEAWYLPAARDIPAGYAPVGTWYNSFKFKSQFKYGLVWSAGSATFRYPNAQRAGTLWFHDHTLGMTRLNVYAGPVGFWLIRGGDDDKVVDTRDRQTATLPSGAQEIPLAIQDRSFNTDGSLFYPDTRAFFDAVAGPYIPATDVPPIWNPEYFGNCMVVNGRTWPFLTVEQRRYRMRLLNGCQSRFLIVDASAIPGLQVWQIGNEGGFLPAPVNLADLGMKLLMGPAERADLIFDFTAVPAGAHTLRNAGPDAPFGGLPIAANMRADPATTGQILQFRVKPRLGVDATTPPLFMRLPTIAPLPVATTTRRLALLESMSRFFAGAPVAALLGTMAATRKGLTPTARLWMDPITENPAPGSTEIWEIYNLTVDAHPIHIHDVLFEVMNRQKIHPSTSQPLDGARPPEPYERGRKDTVTAYPGEVTRVRMTFGAPGRFVWHCHIVEHEDNEMMRPFVIGPISGPV
jgi:spore coat protein A, manganese oxidase